MLISERKLRKIIRQEILREHQELLVEFNLKKIVEKAPKAIPALILMLSAGAMSACDDIQSTTPEELSAKEASIELGLEADPSLEINYDSADTIDGLQSISDEGKKACEDGIKYLEKNKGDINGTAVFMQMCACILGQPCQPQGQLQRINVTRSGVQRAAMIGGRFYQFRHFGRG